MLRTNHYDLAFAHFLQSKRLGYIAVDEHKRAQLAHESLKSLDFIVSIPGKKHLLIDIKGRKSRVKASQKKLSSACLMSDRFNQGSVISGSAGLYENLQIPCANKFPAVNWVTSDDLQGLTRWQEQFGQEFLPLFVFSHEVPIELSLEAEQSPFALSMGEYRSKVYLFSGITLQDYTLYMHQRSKKWNTWWVKYADYRRIVKPISFFL